MMADRTKSFTPVQEAILAVATESYNDRELPKGKDGKPVNPLTPDAYWEERTTGLLSSWGQTHQGTLLTMALTAYTKLKPEDQAKALDILGLGGVPQDKQAKILTALGPSTFLELEPAKQVELFTLLGLGD